MNGGSLREKGKADTRVKQDSVRSIKQNITKIEKNCQGISYSMEMEIQCQILPILYMSLNQILAAQQNYFNVYSSLKGKPIGKKTLYFIFIT